MKRFLLSMAAGAWLYHSYYISSRPGLKPEENKLVQSYIDHHSLDKMLKFAILNGYMQLNKAFLDYGMQQRL